MVRVTKEMLEAGMATLSDQGAMGEAAVRALLEAALAASQGDSDLNHVEIDDGSLTYRSGSLSITVCSDTAIIFDAARTLPARRVKLSYDEFWTDADDFLRRPAVAEREVR